MRVLKNIVKSSLEYHFIISYFLNNDANWQAMLLYIHFVSVAKLKTHLVHKVVLVESQFDQNLYLKIIGQDNRRNTRKC